MTTVSYTKEQLKNLYDFLREKAKEVSEEEAQPIVDFYKQLQAIRYSPLIFKSICKKYINYEMMSCPLKKTLTHINDKEFLNQLLIRWRLESGN